MKLPHQSVPHPLVKADAGLGEGGVFCLRKGDAGVAVEDVLGGQHPFQGPAELGPQAVASLILAEVDGALCGPLIGCPDMEGGGVGIAQQFPCLLCHQIGVGAQGGFHPTGEFRKGGHIVLKGDGGVQHIGAVNGQQGSRILWGSGAKVEGWHGTGPPGGNVLRVSYHGEGNLATAKKFPLGLDKACKGCYTLLHKPRNGKSTQDPALFSEPRTVQARQGAARWNGPGRASPTSRCSSRGDGSGTPLPCAGTCWSALSGRRWRQAGWHRRSCFRFCPCKTSMGQERFCFCPGTIPERSL